LPVLFLGAAGRNGRRVSCNTERVLDLSIDIKSRHTFSSSFWIADKFPHLVRDVMPAVMSLRVTATWHRTVYSLTPQEFPSDTRDAVRAIEDAAGVMVRGYRGQVWSITRDCMWALDILAEEGFPL